MAVSRQAEKNLERRGKGRRREEKKRKCLTSAVLIEYPWNMFWNRDRSHPVTSLPSRPYNHKVLITTMSPNSVSCSPLTPQSFPSAHRSIPECLLSLTGLLPSTLSSSSPLCPRTVSSCLALRATPSPLVTGLSRRAFFLPRPRIQGTSRLYIGTQKLLHTSLFYCIKHP
jgi:hypothetical protein